ncbi:polysaccharide pyruvyl transferase family protein [Solicola sp. PLA-1-18]|uniref:polysaccharide pyruvyl transferase family protein n=1 Tax=Solicola sp. PLA-1-18 TaxID=3380532 RepID=UPI003B7DABC5
MTRILVRAHKSPFRVASVEETRERNLIGDNTGNLVFSQSVFRLLSTEGTELEAARLRRDKAKAINERYDHVVIPLANAFRFSFIEPLDAMSEIIENLTIPVSVVGVGAQATLGGENGRFDDLARPVSRFVKAVLERSPSIGVRGGFTAEYLAGLGFGDDVVDVIGCPSMFMNGPDLSVHKKVDALTSESPIAFNVSPYVLPTGAISQRHAAAYPNLRYMAQDHLTLELMLTGAYPGVKKRQIAAGVPVYLDHPLIAQDRVRFFVDPVTWFDHLKGYDFSFGTRIHGNIAALLAGTPALVLAHDSRTLELADYHQIPRVPVNEITDDVDAAELYAKADWEPMNQGHQQRWEVFQAFLARHGLPHVYQDGQDPSAFDARLDSLDFPAPVQTLMGLTPAELYAMKAELDALRSTPPVAAELRSTVRQRAASVARRLRRG